MCSSCLLFVCGDPTENAWQVPPRPEGEERPVHGITAERCRILVPLPAVDPTHVHPETAVLRLSDQALGSYAELPLRAASDKQHVELVPRDSHVFESVLRDQRHRIPELPDQREYRARELQRGDRVTHPV